MNYIILVGAFQALIALLLSLMHKRGASASALSWLMALIFTHLAANFIINTAFPTSETHKQFNTFISLFYGPVLWMYVAPLSGDKFPRTWYKNLHLLPGAIAAVAYFLIAAYTIAHGGKTPYTIYYYNLVTGYVIVLSLSFYSIRSWLAARYITAFWKEERQLVQLISGLFMAICLVWLPFLFLPRFSPGQLLSEEVHYWLRVFMYLVLLTICLAIVRVKFLVMKYTNTAMPVTSLQQSVAALDAMLPGTATVFTEQEMELAQEVTEHLSETALTAKRQVLTAAQQAAIAGDVHKIMEEAKLFTDPELTLESLAATMRLSRNHLSEVLNQHIGRSFYQYINECRIHQVIHLMDRCKKEQVTPNILSLAFEAGFHSKSSFNQYFKKVVGCTPSAYMKTDAASFDFSTSVLPYSEA